MLVFCPRRPASQSFQSITSTYPLIGATGTRLTDERLGPVGANRTVEIVGYKSRLAGLALAEAQCTQKHLGIILFGRRELTCRCVREKIARAKVCT